MEYIIIVVLIIIGLLIKRFIDEKNDEKKARIKITKEWGRIKEREYTEQDFINIEYRFKNSKNDNLTIDDITWNDLDMDSIFMLLNQTQSGVGQEYLYNMLRHLIVDEKELKEIDRLADYFEKNSTERIDLQMILKRIGKPENISIQEYIQKTRDFGRFDILPDLIMAVGLVGALATITIHAVMGITLTVIMVAVNMIFYYKRKATISNYFTCLIYIIRLVNVIDRIDKLNIEGIKEYTDRLNKHGKTFSNIKKRTWLISAGSDMSGSLGDLILDYVRILFHVDLIKFGTMLASIQNHSMQLDEVIEIIGLLDSMIAVSSFRKYLKEYTKPEFLSDQRKIEIEQVYHPMIQEPVKNAFSQINCALITGSNASGKSTFLKTVAICTILSQTIYTAPAKAYKASFFKVYSSMSLKDNLSNNESYYIVEIKSLKRILDQLKDSVPTLCFVDEVLRGTNTIERIAASAEILRSFARSNSICFAASHDIELSHILEKYYTNYHFQEEVIDNDVKFDYKLYKNRATSRNAIKLLSIIGYNQSIVTTAEKAASHFVENNKWEIME